MKTLFAETQLGKFCLAMVFHVTKPFVQMNESSHAALVDPKLFTARRAVKKSQQVLNRLKKQTKEDMRHAKTMAILGATTRMNLQSFANIPAVEDAVKRISGELGLEVQRLRPPLSKETVKKATEYLETLRVLIESKVKEN